MKKTLSVLLCLLMGGMLTAQQQLPAAGDADHAAVEETAAERDMRMDWWRKAKFGMFIHYGLYSGLAGEFRGIPGGTEWLQKNLELDSDTYAAEAMPLFCPKEDCADAWCELAEAAGCRYVVFTSKHHDGFALFRTAVSDYSSHKLMQRDLVQEVTEAARRRGMRVGLYHSVIDWHHPAYDNTICPDLCYPSGQAEKLKQAGIARNQAEYRKFLHTQVRELLEQYGTIDILWWDYSQGAAEGERAWGAPELIRMCRSKNPDIIMNNRLYAFSGFDKNADTLQLDLRCGDFTTPEKRLPDDGCAGTDWESCMTVGDKWGYNRYDRNFKTPAVIIRQLQHCAAKGGNLLLNIGPKADGTIPEETESVFRSIGKWMAVNGESIYESIPVPSLHLPEGWLACVVGEDFYLFPPAEKPQEDVVLRIRAQEVDTVYPEVLGQEDCEIAMERVEEPGEIEPQAFMQFTIPVSAWQNAVEHMPVIRLTNDN